jgi:5-amino-6-(5-phosphoribosylamino)uracil reductase
MQMSVDAQAWRLTHGLSGVLPVAVVSSRGVIPPQLLNDSTVPPIVLVSARASVAARRALAESHARVTELPEGRISSAAIRNALGQLGLNRVLVEGGPSLFSQLVSDEEIDELCLTTSPMMVAGPARRIAGSDHHVETHMHRRDILLGNDGTIIVRWVRP